MTIVQLYTVTIHALGMAVAEIPLCTCGGTLYN